MTSRICRLRASRAARRIDDWRRSIVAITLVASVLATLPSSAENRDMQPQIDQLMRRYDGAVPGASLLILRDGKAVVRRSYGLANLEEKTAATPQLAIGSRRSANNLPRPPFCYSRKMAS